jgi:hypothetical protein
MSKSYGNYISVGFAEGDNTKYYKNRRKIARNKNKMRLISSLQDEDEDFIEFKQPKKDYWREPTDGTYRKKASDPELQYYKGVYPFKNKIKK